MDHIRPESLLTEAKAAAYDLWEKIFSSVGMALLNTALFVGGLALQGFVAADMWGWFVVPLGVPDVTFWHAMGLLFFLRATRIDSRQPKHEKPFYKRASLVCAVWLVSWGLAWCYAWAAGTLH